MVGFDLFFSYRHIDASLARSIVAALREAGLRVWFDESDVRDFASIARSIRDGLAHARAMVVLYSSSYAESRYCQWELTAAFLAAQHEGEVHQRILVLNPEPTDAHIQPVQLRDGKLLHAHKDPADLARRVQRHLVPLTTLLGAIRPLTPPHDCPIPLPAIASSSAARPSCGRSTPPSAGARWHLSRAR